MIIEWLRRHQEIAVPLAFMLASIGVLSYSTYRGKDDNPSLVARTVISIIGFGQSTVTETTGFFGDKWRRYVYLVGVEKENRELERRIDELKRKNNLLNEEAIENERLRRLLNFQPKETIGKWIPAEVTGHSPAGLPKYITIDKGSLDGIKPRMAVIAYDGALVGQILDEPGSEIGLEHSHVLLLTDRRSRVNVLVQRTRAWGVLNGRPESDDCELLYVDRLADVLIGDLVVSSSYGGVFRKGLPAGRVVEIVRDPSKFAPLIRVKPIADFSKLEEVMVIVSEAGP